MSPPPPATPHPAMALVHRYQRGDIEARNALMERWYARGQAQVRVLVRAGLSHETASDLMMDALLQATEKVVRREVKSNPDAMFLRTLAGFVSHHRRHAAYEDKLVEDAEEGALGDAGWLTRSVINPDTLDQIAVQRTLSQMSNEDLQILALVEIEEKTIEEAAQDLELHPKACSRRLARARLRFMKLCEEGVTGGAVA